MYFIQYVNAFSVIGDPCTDGGTDCDNIDHSECDTNAKICSCIDTHKVEAGGCVPKGLLMLYIIII